MISKSKKIISTLLILTLLFSVPVAVNAQEPVPITPYWSNTSTIAIGLSFEGSKGTLSYSVIGEPGTTRIDGLAVLERHNADGTYTEVNRWSGITINSDYLPWGATYYVSTGYEYRFTFTCVVFRNGTTEVVPMSYSNYA